MWPLGSWKLPEAGSADWMAEKTIPQSRLKVPSSYSFNLETSERHTDTERDNLAIQANVCTYVRTYLPSLNVKCKNNDLALSLAALYWNSGSGKVYQPCTIIPVVYDHRSSKSDDSMSRKGVTLSSVHENREALSEAGRHHKERERSSSWSYFLAIREKKKNSCHLAKHRQR